MEEVQLMETFPLLSSSLGMNFCLCVRLRVTTWQTKAKISDADKASIQQAD